MDGSPAPAPVDKNQFRCFLVSTSFGVYGTGPRKFYIQQAPNSTCEDILKAPLYNNPVSFNQMRFVKFWLLLSFINKIYTYNSSKVDTLERIFITNKFRYVTILN